MVQSPSPMPIQSSYHHSHRPSPEGDIHSLIATLGDPIVSQNQSILFGGIPPEIRNKIFSFALYSYDDLSRPFLANSYYTRPGYRFHQRISTSLLETCRRIYSETHDLPVSQNEHVFWCGSYRRPNLSSDNVIQYFSRFTKEQMEAVVQVHLFTQLFWLEGNPFKRMCEWEGMKLKNLKITIRHTDWRYWEVNAPLEFSRSWGDHLKSMKGLETLEVELEAMERDKNQLETIVKSALSWRFNISKTQYLATDGKTIRNEKYLGQSCFEENGGLCMIYYKPWWNRWINTLVPRGGPKPKFPPELTCVISSLRWNTFRNQEIS